jgi:phosphoribosyl 1,2-cyclic phosphate phosphodiesterase
VTLTFLGTGTSAGVPMVGCGCAVCTSDDPRDQRLRSSVLIEAAGGTVLIDAGPDLRQQLLRTGVKKLDAVVLTHAHIDHIAGIDELRAFNFFQKRAVPILGSEATLAAVQRMFAYAFEKEKYPGTPELELRPISDAPFTVAGIELVPVQVQHYRMPVNGYRAGRMAYITDAKSIDPGEREKLRGLDVLVLNALRKEPHISHLTFTEALALAAELRPRRTWFTHMSHQMGRHADVSRELPDGTALAHDGLRLDLE